MTRFIQQQIPPTPTRQVAKTPCPTCPNSVLGDSVAKSHPKVKPTKKKKK